MKISELMEAPLQNLYGMRLLELVLRHLNVNEDDMILDIGCGSGFASFILSKRSKGVIGIDISQPLISLLNEQSRSKNVEFYVMDATKEPPDEFLDKFDKCVCIDVLEHVEDPSAVLNFIYKILKRSGESVITFPLNRTEHGRNYLTQESAYSLFRITELQADVKSVKQSAFGSFISRFYAWVQNILEPPKEANTFHDVTCFKMMTKRKKIHSLYKLGIIILFKMTQNSYRETPTGRRALIITGKL